MILNINKSNSAINDKVIKLPTKEKYVIPNINGPSDNTIAMYRIFFALIAVLMLPFIQ